MATWPFLNEAGGAEDAIIQVATDTTNDSEGLTRCLTSLQELPVSHYESDRLSLQFSNYPETEVIPFL